MGNICEIFSKNNKYYDDDIIYYNKKNKEETIIPAIEKDDPPNYNSINYNSINYNSINYNQSKPIQIVYDPSIQIMEYKRPIYIDNYIDNYTSGGLAEPIVEDIFYCD